MFYNVFCSFLRNYCIHCLFDILFFHETIPIYITAYFYRKYYYSLLYCSFNIIFFSLKLILLRFSLFLFEFDQYVGPIIIFQASLCGLSIITLYYYH